MPVLQCNRFVGLRMITKQIYVCVTSSPLGEAKYCVDRVCLSVCLSVREHISETIYTPDLGVWVLSSRSETWLQCFDAVGWAAGRASGLYKMSGGVLVWLSVWSEVQTCMWPSWCHCHPLSLASVKSRLVLPFWYRLTWVVPDKGPLNVCVYWTSVKY